MIDKPLSPFEQWMVKSNLETIESGAKTLEQMEILVGNGYPRISKAVAKGRLEYLRGELRNEKISTAELIELESLIPYIEPGDVELLEAAGVPEFPESGENQ